MICLLSDVMVMALMTMRINAEGMQYVADDGALMPQSQGMHYGKAVPLLWRMR